MNVAVKVESVEPTRSVGTLDRLTASFFGVPKSDVPHLQAHDWMAHRAVIVFLLIVVLPLNAVSFGHLSTLILASAGGTALLSADQVYWATAVGGGLFGVLLAWLNDSGMTIMLRRSGRSWQKVIGLLSRGLFVVLNIVLFAAAITAFSLRDRIEFRRGIVGANDTAERTQITEQAVVSLTKDIEKLAEEKAEQSKKLDVLSPQTIEIRKRVEDCQRQSSALEQSLPQLRSQLKILDNQIASEKARQQANLAGGLSSPQEEKSIGELSRRRKVKSNEIRRTETDLSQNRGRCQGLDNQAMQSQSDHLEDVRGGIATTDEQITRKSGELDKAKTRAEEERNKAGALERLGFGKNLGAEFAALSGLLMDPAEIGARLTAIVVALFFGLIDLTPLIWGWSLRKSSIDFFLERRAEAYLRGVTASHDAMIRQIEADDAAQAAYIAARSSEETAHHQRRALFEADLAAAKQYADAVAALEKMLASEDQCGTSSGILDRVRHESVEALSATFRAKLATERI